MNKKIILVICLMSLFTVGCGCQKKNKPIKTVKEDLGIDINFDVIEEKEVAGLKITNISLVTEDGISSFKASVINTTSRSYNVKNITLIFKDEKGNTIDELTGVIGRTLSPDGEANLNVKSLFDVSKAKSVEYVVNK